MTVACGGGSSSARSGYGLGVTVGTGVLAALLNNVPTSQAIAVAAAIGVLNFELSIFCNSDPPAMPTLTAQDYFDVLGGGGVIAQLAAVDKFRDAVGNVVWPTFCQCDTVATPAVPTWPTLPVNVPVYQPPQLPSASVQQPCWSSRQNVDTSSGLVIVNYPKLLWPTGRTNDSDIGNNQRAVSDPLPTLVSFEGISTPTGSNGITGQQLTIRFLNSAFSEISHVTSTGGVVANPKVSGVPPAGSAFIEFDPAYTVPVFSSAATGTATNIVTLYCAGQSSVGPQSPCCPPDPSLQASLQEILSLLKSVYLSSPPQLNSYADGTVHAGLSGNGTITLAASVLGIRVNITTDPVSLGLDVGDPTYLFDRGFIVPVVNAAPIRAESRLVYNPQMFLLPALTEQIGYSLHAGVVVSITELVRGP